VLRLVQEEGAPKRGGALVQRLHQTSQGFFKGGAFYKWVKAKSTQGKGKGQRKEARGLAKEEGRTKAKGAFVQGLAGTSTRNSKASKVGLLLYQVHLYLFPCCTHALRSPNIYIYL
jgi:hypothetical protein